MKLAIMQPYLFPYIGYFQLLNAADKFVFYDDVNFIKQGWINRNRILLNGEPHLFTVPLKKISSFSLIKDTGTDQRADWGKKILQTIRHSYQKAPYFNDVFPVIEKVFDGKENNISKLAINSVKSVAAYLGIKTSTVDGAAAYQNNELAGPERVLDICRQENATEYINAPGGMELYDREIFKAKGIDLQFIRPKEIRYRQFGENFVPHLSVIDVLMFNPVAEVKRLLNEYEFC
jgi:hypothetical protein